MACHQAARAAAWQERFWANVRRAGPDECWLWQGRDLYHGYGRMRVPGRGRVGVHRIAWELLNGPVPDGLLVLHTCDVLYPADDITSRRCCNPAHMFLGTNEENSYDRHAKGRDYGGDRHWTRTNPEKCARGDAHPMRQHPERVKRGEDVHGALLTADGVRQARVWIAQGVPQIEVARRLGVSPNAINRMHKGRTWRHVH
jgi:hypothetical protein